MNFRAVQSGHEIERSDVVDFILGDERRAERSARGEDYSVRVLVGVKLPITNGPIIGAVIAGNMIEGFFAGNSAADSADYGRIPS